MRKLTSHESHMLDQALGTTWIGVIASQRIEGEEVPMDTPRPEVELDEGGRYRLAQAFGIIRG